MQIDTFLARWRGAGGSGRATEVATGHIRWLRPDFQNPGAGGQRQQQRIDQPAATPIKAIGKGPWKKHLPQLLETLIAFSHARQSGAGQFGASR